MELSEKQRLIWLFPYMPGYDALICDGSIRSGKTSNIMFSYIDWAMTVFDGCNFIICGKTVGSAYRNVVQPFLLAKGWHQYRGYSVSYRRGENVLTVKANGKENRFLVFGAKDKSSYQLIQGFTAAGCMVDECALCDRSAVEQALGRCSVDGSKFFFNCNPGDPEHWFLKEWILQAEEKKALHLHFTMEDNPGLSAAVRERYERMYSGVFHRRYIKGEWVLAEGLVYPFEWETINEDVEPEPGELCYVGIDYGITNPFACELAIVRNGVAYVVGELVWDSRAEGSRKTDGELYQMMAEWLKPYNVDCLVVDPSASSFIEEVERAGKYYVIKADNAVNEGIQTVSTAFNQGNLKVHSRCRNLKTELGLYRWDETKHDGKDHVVKESDHSLDALRYLTVNTLIDLLPCFEWRG